MICLSMWRELNKSEKDKNARAEINKKDEELVNNKEGVDEKSM